MRPLLRLLSIVCFAMPLAANAYTDDSLLIDYTGLTKLLRANGVEPSKVDWAPIEAMCLGLKEPTSQIKYNSCRYNKALDQTIYYADNATCKEEADAYVPPQANTNISTSSKSADGSQSTSITSGPVYVPDLRSSRRAVFTRCMMDLGWQQPRNWQLGRTTK